MERRRERRRRAIVLVIDGCGVGALPDAERYGDAETNTLAHLAEAAGGLRLPTLERLGLGCILPLRGVAAVRAPAIHGRLHALGPGKDSTVGHWELMGAVLSEPQPTFPEGLPRELLARLEAVSGERFVCNSPSNGIAAIQRFGGEHLRSGALVIYTSIDSVVQVAAHVDRMRPERLYEVCESVRAELSGDAAVGRVIARPFCGGEGAFERTSGRRDFSLAPPAESCIAQLARAGVPIHGVGKIADLFGGDGAIERHDGASNATALASASALLEELDRGFVFVNLIETDQVYGHRKDVDGFHMALREIDGELGRWLGRLRDGDLLIVSADHGVDLAHPRSDHTREHAPLLALTGAMLSGDGGLKRAHPRHDGPLADVGASVLAWLTGADGRELAGECFLEEDA